MFDGLYHEDGFFQVHKSLVKANMCKKKSRFIVPKIVAIKMLDPLVHYQTIRISTLEFGITSSNKIRHNSLLYNGF